MAYDRMDQRGCSPKDVRNALVLASECSVADRDCWRVTGPDLDGDELTLIVALSDDVLVVTVY